jgi:hypothetical protein
LTSNHPLVAILPDLEGRRGRERGKTLQLELQVVEIRS